jgi:phage terminase large subunit
MIQTQQKQKQKIVKLSDKVLPRFKSFWNACDKYLIKVLKGGRNSSKSTHISIKMINDLCKYPVNALVVRKVGNTLDESCYEQLKWAIEYLEIEHLFDCKKNPLRITYKPRGNRIIFRGADDPAKIKSLKTSKFPITILWIEELAEFKTEDEVDVIVNSVLRATLPDGLKYSIFYSYNPPKRKQNWVNKKYNSKFVSKNTYIHHSDYRDNKYCSSAFLEEVENVKERNLNKYKWIYLGEAIGGGVVPFENLVFRKITDDEVNNFDNIRQGIDWGYAADPFAFVRIHYDKMRRKIYFIDEIYGVKLSNREVAQKIKEKKYFETILADCAEPKSIAEMKEYGLNCIGAKKGAGSVEYGEKWLDDLEEIVIDYERTPNTAKEFENIDYQVDRDGNIKSKLEDKDNHSIDSARYSLNNDMVTTEAILF